MLNSLNGLTVQTLHEIRRDQTIVLLRADLNVPFKEGQPLNTRRVEAVWPTLRAILERAPKAVLILSHWGRPKEGVFQVEYSLKPLQGVLERLTGQCVHWIDLPRALRWLSQPMELEKFTSDLRRRESATPPLLLIENTRFLEGEASSDPTLARQLASWGEVVVMDAFATAHRNQASTTGLVQCAKRVGPGFLMERECAVLESVLKAKRPILGVLGGAKLSTKLKWLEQALEQWDLVAFGGAVATTFLVAVRPELRPCLGRSWMEEEAIQKARALQASHGRRMLHPIDFKVEHSRTGEVRVMTVHSIEKRPLLAEESIVDVGPATLEAWARVLDERRVQTVVWNGPLGLLERPSGRAASRHWAEVLAQRCEQGQLEAYAGGGETTLALEEAGVLAKMTYVSTGGGALLAGLGGRPLPVVEALCSRWA